MKLYRGIAVNETGEIRNNEIGISWTLDNTFASERAELMAKNDFNNDNSVRPLVIEANINDDMIDWAATLGQMKTDYFEKEYEVILLPNIDITYRIIEDSMAMYLQAEELDTFEDINGNTGRGMYDETMGAECSDEDIEEYKAEFYQIANEF